MSPYQTLTPHEKTLFWKVVYGKESPFRKSEGVNLESSRRWVWVERWVW